MDLKPDTDFFHVKPDSQLPTIPTPIPTVEVLKQLMEQMLENERRRVRNEFVRMSFVFIVLLLVLMVGGFWVAQNIITQLREERQLTEHARHDIAELLSTHPAGKELATPSAQTSVPSETKQLIGSLEQKNKAMEELLTAQTSNMKDVIKEALAARETEIKELHAQVDKSGHRAIQSLPDDDRPVPPKTPVAKPPPAVEGKQPDKIAVPNTQPLRSIPIRITPDMPLRAVIPAP